MTIVETIAEELSKAIASKYQYFSTGTRADIKAMIVRKFSPLVPDAQPRLDFVDLQKNKAHAAAILKLLKERRSEGATNVEFSDICLNYTARISELRRPPHNYKIFCTKEQGRLTRYRLHAFDWGVK